MKTALFSILTAIVGIILGMVVVYGSKVMPLKQQAREADRLLVRLQVEADAATAISHLQPNADYSAGFKAVSDNIETIRQTLAAD